jgi:hypothetical protein
MGSTSPQGLEEIITSPGATLTRLSRLDDIVSLEKAQKCYRPTAYRTTLSERNFFDSTSEVSNNACDTFKRRFCTAWYSTASVMYPTMIPSWCFNGFRLCAAMWGWLAHPRISQAMLCRDASHDINKALGQQHALR